MIHLRHEALTILAALAMASAPVIVEAQGPDRSGPPPLGAPPRLSLPEIQRHELSNGLQVMVVEKHTVPLVQINLVVGVGAAHDPSDRIALAREFFNNSVTAHNVRVETMPASIVAKLTGFRRRAWL